MKLHYSIFLVPCSILFLTSCSVSKQISKEAQKILLADTAISKGHIGISIYEPATGRYWYNHNADKYFIPASNTKLFTLYAGMKYLGDSLPGLRFKEKNDTLIIFPTADPTFLHPDFKQQPVFDFLINKKNIQYCTQLYTDYLGVGWAWDDYLESYMTERNEFPIYGNLIRVYKTKDGFKYIPKTISLDVQKGMERYGINVEYKAARNWDNNDTYLYMASPRPNDKTIEVPLATNLYEVPDFLADTIHQKIDFITHSIKDSIENNDARFSIIYSQPSDSLFKPMMHNSDNFFAEQTLLMASNEYIGYMNDEAMIDTLLKTDLKAVPQKPRWVDGSGLSRYNLFTPQSFVYILDKMKNEFGLDRMKNILLTGGQGTLKNYFIKDSSFIFAKTGTISNNCSLSGFLITSKGKLLIFSILANNYLGSATPVRRAIEHFLYGIREKY